MEAKNSRMSLHGRVAGLACLFAFNVSGVWALSGISPEEAINHAGERATVCGTVVTAKYSVRSNGQPTFLNLDYPYPRQVFTALVWGRDRSKFQYPPESLEGQSVCVNGLIKSYKGTAEIIVRDASQITKE